MFLHGWYPNGFLREQNQPMSFTASYCREPRLTDRMPLTSLALAAKSLESSTGVKLTIPRGDPEAHLQISHGPFRRFILDLSPPLATSERMDGSHKVVALLVACSPGTIQFTSQVTRFAMTSRITCVQRHIHHVMRLPRSILMLNPFLFALQHPATTSNRAIKMSLQQSLLRPARQLAVQLQSPLMRRALVRSRFMSTETSTSTTSSIKVRDNAFNRERQAIKDHAAATSGESTIDYTSVLQETNLRQISGENSPSSESSRANITTHKYID